MMRDRTAVHILRSERIVYRRINFTLIIVIKRWRDVLCCLNYYLVVQYTYCMYISLGETITLEVYTVTKIIRISNMSQVEHIFVNKTIGRLGFYAENYNNLGKV